MSDELDVPKSTLKPLYSYEKLLQEGDETFPFSTNIKENDPAGMGYTSATTGMPKGVVYTHRGIVHHSMAVSMADTAAMSAADGAMPVVQRFLVKEWGVPST